MFTPLVMRVVCGLVALGLVLGACSDSDSGSETGSSNATTSTDGSGDTTMPPTTVPAYPLDDELRLNEIQVIGTHNSYHLPATPEFKAAVDELIPGLTDAFNYRHRPLPEQLADLGVRQFELDIFNDPEGNLYNNRKAYVAAGLPADGGHPELSDPGMKVLHVQEIDAESTCATLVICLTEIRDWSEANQGHVPVFVLIEAKSDVIPDLFDMGFVDPLPFDAAALDALDAEIRSVFSEDQLITPDLVRGDHDTLSGALTDTAWPSMGEVRGRVMFLLDNGGEVADLYRAGHPSLEGRVLFTGDAEPGDPDAAFLKRNDALDDSIPGLVADGYLVRTRSDGDAHLSTEDPSPGRDAALASGAQFVSTDYVEPNLVAFPDYVVRMPDGGLVRCNPVLQPENCTASDVENPATLVP